MANHLASESSPYLLQHAGNPVDWYPWGPEALGKARAEDKPIFLSIGYSACHWCHVMERESFEDESTAAFLNEHFVSIKVDREERPDLDAVYMGAVQALTGQGRLAPERVAHAGRRPVLRGNLLPSRLRARAALIPAGPGGHRPSLDHAAGRPRPDRRHRARTPGRRPRSGPSRDRRRPAAAAAPPRLTWARRPALQAGRDSWTQRPANFTARSIGHRRLGRTPPSSRSRWCSSTCWPGRRPHLSLNFSSMSR